MKLNEMKQLLAEHGIRLTKSLGQNFLHDANQLRRIVAAAELGKADRVLEVGPGLGPLTELLAQQSGEVLAIEKDAKLVEVLRGWFRAEQGSLGTKEGRGERGEERGKSEGRSPKAEVEPRRGEDRREEGGRLHLVHDDALEYLRREPRDWSGWKLVANLPYSVASPMLVELAAAEYGPQRMVVTLQLEVARRLLAKPGEPDYGVLTLLVQLTYAPQSWFKVPASCFFPEPDVDSACVCLLRREQSLLAFEQRSTYMKLVKRGFSQRRKMMFKLLKQDWPEHSLAIEFERLNISPRTRAEEVSLEQFAQLARGLSGHSQ